MPPALNMQRHSILKADFYVDTFFNPIWMSGPNAIPDLKKTKQAIRATEARVCQNAFHDMRHSTSDKANNKSVRPWGTLDRLPWYMIYPMSQSASNKIPTRWLKTTVQKRVPSDWLPQLTRQEPTFKPATDSNQIRTGEFVSWPPVLRPCPTSQESANSSSTRMKSDVPRPVTTSRLPQHEFENVVPLSHKWTTKGGFLDEDTIPKPHLRHDRVPLGVLYETNGVHQGRYGKGWGGNQTQLEMGSTVRPESGLGTRKRKFPKGRPVPPPLDMSRIRAESVTCDVIYVENGEESEEDTLQTDYDTGDSGSSGPSTSDISSVNWQEDKSTSETDRTSLLPITPVVSLEPSVVTSTAQFGILDRLTKENSRFIAHRQKLIDFLNNGV